MASKRVPIIGIVGGIGSGKSTVARAFEALGCRLIDADRLGHEMLSRAEVFAELVTEFGPGIQGEDGRIDRGSLARVAFADEASTARLNEIVGGALWPEFRRRSLEAADHPAEGEPAVVLDAALLYESGADDLCDAVVFVDAPESTRRRRVAEARGWDWAEAARREARQFPLSRKRAMADFSISNAGPKDRLAEDVRGILAAVRKRFFTPDIPEADLARDAGGQGNSAS